MESAMTGARNIGCPIEERYRRAAALTAPKVAASTAQILDRGYWITERQYFYLEERMLPSGRALRIPRIVDAVEQTSMEVLSAEAIVSIIGGYTGDAVDCSMLCVADFEMPTAECLAVHICDRWYLIDWRKACVVEENSSLGTAGLYSPNGRFACFLKGYDVWLKNLMTGEERQLTYGGVEYNSYARQPDTCLEAISYKDRPYPVGLWSPDSRWFITHRTDERQVPDLSFIQHALPDGGRPIVHRLKYPMPGDPLASARYVAINVESGQEVEFKAVSDSVGFQSPFILKNIWFIDNETVALIRFDRHYKKVELFSLNLHSGSSRLLVSEGTEEGYVELNQFVGRVPNVRVISRSLEVIWFSERDGRAHLYLYDGRHGELKNRITVGDYVVRDIVHIDENRRTVLFLAGALDPRVDPMRRSLCEVGLDGTGFNVLLTYDGDLYVPLTVPSGSDQYRRFRPANALCGVSPDGRFFAVRKSSLKRGNLGEILSRETGKGFCVGDVTPAEDEVLPEEFTATAADGVTTLYGAMFFPRDFDQRLLYPVIDYIYPGPQVAHKPQSYRQLAAGPAMSVAALGFVSIMLDSRGMPGRSRSFHQAGYGSLKEPQLADHAAVIRQLCARHSFLDRGRVGIIGMSGGGSAAVKAMCDYADVFHVGVSASGEYDEAFYNSSWADKYCGSIDRKGKAPKPMWTAVKKLKGSLLLISGDMDENVSVSQTFMLVDGLIRANKNFDLLVVPNGRHFVFLDNGYAQRRLWDYLVRNLLAETPPAPKSFSLKFEPHEIDRMFEVWRSSVFSG